MKRAERMIEQYLADNFQQSLEKSARALGGTPEQVATGAAWKFKNAFNGNKFYEIAKSHSYQKVLKSVDKTFAVVVVVQDYSKLPECSMPEYYLGQATADESQPHELQANAKYGRTIVYNDGTKHAEYKIMNVYPNDEILEVEIIKSNMLNPIQKVGHVDYLRWKEILAHPQYWSIK